MIERLTWQLFRPCNTRSNSLGSIQPIIDAARRRLGVIREVLHTLATPKFGRRDIPLQTLAPEQRHRQLLGLPLDRRLSAPEIHRAWKRAAKSAHPDAGGSAQAFLALSAAREALIAEVRFSRV